MKARYFIESLVFALALAAVFLAVNGGVRADDFTLMLTINGEDITEVDSVSIDADGEFVVDLRIYDNTSEIVLHQVNVAATFTGFTVLTLSEPLDDYLILPGEYYRRQIPVNARELLGLGDATLTVGIYRSEVQLEYSVNGHPEVWSSWVDIQVVGNPLKTPAGIAGVATGILTVGAFAWLIHGLSSLYKFALGRLESLARGRVVGSIVNAAKKHIIKEKCPVCETRFKNDYCYTCGKPAKQIRHEYRHRLRELAKQGQKLLADGTVTEADLAAALNISDRTAGDVIAVMNNARMYRVRGFGRRLMVKAIFSGICFAISTIIWVTVGGFAVLSTPALVAILVAAIVIPLVITWGFHIKARRAIRRRASQTA